MNSPQRPIRVLYLIDSLGVGGAERSLSEMLPLLRDRQITLSVCAMTRTSDNRVDTSGYPVRYLQAQTRMSRVRELREILKTEVPDVLHTTIIEANIVGRFAAIGTGVPVLSSLVSTPYVPARFEDPNVSAWKLRVVQAVDGWTGRHRTDWFHAITDAVRDASVRDLRLPPDRVTVIRRGRDESRFKVPGTEQRENARARLGLAPEAKVLLNVGRQEYPKGQRDLLDAFSRVAQKHPDARLLIAGRAGKATPELKEQMAQSALLQETVQFLGHREDIPDILAAADLFLFPSLYEGLGGAVIEAMAVGLPIVASSIPALREVVEDGQNADLVPPGSPAEFADTVLELLEDPERRIRYGQNSRERFEARFRLGPIVDQTTGLYQDIVSRSGEKSTRNDRLVAR